MMSLKEAIRAKATELGFDGCHVTTADRPEGAGMLRDWLDKGYHGKMGWLERNAEKRSDPQRVLPGARSIIVLTLNYGGAERDEGSPVGAAGGTSSETSDGSMRRGEQALGRGSSVCREGAARGVIARYARYRDYHKVIGKRLKRLAELIQEHAGEDARSLTYVDTGPILERDLAQRAGAGFIGKHTNLISRELGNWLFLSEILTTVELEPDVSERNRCGACRRCLDACPTEAIRRPFELDARRCISYLTIELPGSIPVELRPLIGNRIFGCDDCLAVCPWNRFAREGSLMKQFGRDDMDQPHLLELLRLDEGEFHRRFAGTPIHRTKRRGLLRNVCVALGNVGGPEAIPALREAMEDSEPLIAEHADWAIRQIGKRYEASKAST